MNLKLLRTREYKGLVDVFEVATYHFWTPLLSLWLLLLPTIHQLSKTSWVGSCRIKRAILNHGHNTGLWHVLNSLPKSGYSAIFIGKKIVCLNLSVDITKIKH